MEIIDKPDKKTILRKITELSFTTFIWGIWVYLFFPILNLLLWVIGIRIFYVEIIESAGYLEFLDLVGKAGWGILIVFFTLRTWGWYNYWRFGRKDRRTARPSDTILQQFSEHFQIPVAHTTVLQSKKEVIWPLEGDLNQDVVSWLSKPH